MERAGKAVGRPRLIRGACEADGSFRDPTSSAELGGAAATRLQPEKRLILAVLDAAVNEFQAYATASSGRGRRIFADVEAWFRSTATDGLFDFETICHAL